MRKLIACAIGILMAFSFAAPGNAMPVASGNNVHTFQAGAFEAHDGWYSGEILVGWHGNGNNTTDLTFTGNTGDVVATPFTVESNKQREGAVGVEIEMTAEEQEVVFTLTRVNGKSLTTTVEVPALYADTVTTHALRTAINPGYYYSGALIDAGITMTAGSVDKDSFLAKARVTEYNGDVQGGFGNFGWDPEKSDYALGDGWAMWNVVDAYVSDADGNRVEKGQYVKLDIEWGTRTVEAGNAAERYDVPATRAAWYVGASPWTSYMSFATVDLEIEPTASAPVGLLDADFVQGETQHDPLFDQFQLSEAPGGGMAALYTPDNATADNRRPLLVWFHGTGERYNGGNAGGNLVGNRALSFADEEFQSALDGAYVLAPQSTTSGWNQSRLADMEQLIQSVIDNNHVDPDRVYVGGLSMGTGMTTPLITSLNEGAIDFAAAMLVSGGGLSAAQAGIVADKGIAVYLVGNTSDGAANNQPAALENLLAAGADAKMMRYPAGPVFDGTYYYGAHDSWNYVYNNLVVDEEGVTIFEWLANQRR
ncbi:PHB depolymerase family esterase [Tessaracoccus flavus]|uniref:Uncharacterized protein n=1 Tax=Tessaracoccus flavus TaxID=1610493 RepID=A0A1Q2CE77_9ACTN|nr:PHB depolymerase family esterase [Tessaracoccus flavus]AQP44432.1 hypothetical protein RPIT_06070 [Tessaracoccus flavus]SDY69219.1 Esterase PHB depolymerase [Tessaracoccus flavus]